MTKTIFKRVRSSDRGKAFSAKDAEDLIIDVTNAQKDLVRAQLTTNAILHAKRVSASIDPSEAIKFALADFDTKWDQINTRLAMIPGKDFIKQVSSHCQENYGRSITIPMIQEDLSSELLDPKILEKLNNIKKFCSD